MKYPKARPARHPIGTGALTIMSALRNQPVGNLIVENDKWIVPEFYFSWDAEQGNTSIGMSHLDDRTFRIEADISGNPSWCTMNFGLGRGKLSAGDILGIALGAKNETRIPLEGFIRSATPADGPQDTPLSDRLAIGPDRSHVVALQTLTEWDPLTWGEDDFHTLVLTLPQQAFRFDLIDLRVFVLSKAFGLKSGLPTLTNTRA